MAWTYGFFNSVNGDRLYNAEQMGAIFDGLITNGIYESIGNKLAVQANSGMIIQVSTGRGWFSRHWVNNSAELLLTLDSSDVVLNRYAAVVVKVDDSDSVRSAVVNIKYSDFATNPVKPTMERSELINEYCLAYIYIAAGATEITAADIEDTRGNTELCGWVTGLIEQLSTTTLFEQWEQIFKDWFLNLQDLINENTETMLVNALPVSVVVTLAADGWAWNDEAVGFTQDVEVLSMNDTKTVLVQPETASESVYSACEITCIAQATTTLTFKAVSEPTESINVNIIHMGA